MVTIKPFDTITNIMTFEEEISRLNNKDYLLWLQKLSDLINIFFHWENTFITFHDRINLSKSLLKKYMYNVDSLELGIDYISMIQEKVQMDYECYFDLLNELFEYNDTHNVNIDKQTKNEIFLFKFYINKSIVQENIKSKNIKYLIKWLHEPSVM